MSAPLRWAKANEAVQETRKMICESAGWGRIQADGLCLKNSGGLMFEVDCFARRDGPHLHAVKFHLMPSKQSRSIERFLLAAFIYRVWPERCTKLFGDEGAKDGSCRVVSPYWAQNSDSRMFRALDKAFEGESLECNPAVKQLAANVAAAVSKLDKPVDLHIRDIIHPLKMAIAKGASRDDLIRLVDEAFVEEVQKS